MYTARKQISLLVCIAIVLVVVLSSLFFAEHAGHSHSCQVEHCKVCVTLARFGDVLRQLGAAVAAALTLAPVPGLFRGSGSLISPWAVPVPLTPISLRVQMNN